jgi:hypothetical protein
MQPWFELDSGHKISLEQFFFRNTDEGFLEGSPRSISALVLEHLPSTISKVFWECNATLILKPAAEVLPRYTFFAHLTCLDSVPNQEPGYYSRLLVAWFGEDLTGSLVDLTHNAVRTVDWDRHAENWVD